MTDQEFEERTKTRAEETKAVSEALAILSSDDAHDTFTSTFNFLQVETGWSLSCAGSCIRVFSFQQKYLC